MTGDSAPLHSDSLTKRLDINFALKAAGLGIWELDPVTRIVNWDDQCRALFGLAKDNQLPYEQAIQYIHPEDVDRVNEAVQLAITAGSDGQYDVTYRTIGADDGLLRWVRFHGRAHFTPAGKVYQFAGVAQEVTQMVETQQKLKESKAQLDSLVQQTPAPTLVLRGDEYRIDQINQPMLAFMGRGEEVIGQPFLSIMPELAGQFAWQQVQRVYQEGVDFDLSEVLVPHVRHGVLQDIYYNVSYRPLREGGQITGIIQVATDVTEQVVSRQKLEDSESKLRAIITTAPAGIGLFVGRDLVIENPNQTFIDIVGKGPAITGLPLREAMPELISEGQPFLQILDDVFTTGEPFISPGSLVKIVQNGVLNDNYYNISYSPVRNVDGEVYAILDIAIDVTAQIKAQQALAESEARYRVLSAELEQQVQERTEDLASVNEELAAGNEELAASNEEYAAINEELEEANSLLARSNDDLQKFAYVASHDLQEPLRKIQQFGDLLKARYVATGGEELLHLDRMQAAASRMATLIRDLLDFSRVSNQRELNAMVSLNDIVNRALTTLELVVAETSATITVGSLPSVLGDISQLDQLFQNLLSNALKFRKPDDLPVIHIRAHTLTANQLPELVRPARLASAYHRIDVIDNGVGFDEKYLDRIFQVFQRLYGKNEYVGTGIGLAICEKVVANHGGAITARSQLGQGATFSVYLPLQAG